MEVDSSGVGGESFESSPQIAEKFSCCHFFVFVWLEMCVFEVWSGKVKMSNYSHASYSGVPDLSSIKPDVKVALVNETALPYHPNSFQDSNFDSSAISREEFFEQSQPPQEQKQEQDDGKERYSKQSVIILKNVLTPNE